VFALESLLSDRNPSFQPGGTIMTQLPKHNLIYNIMEIFRAINDYLEVLTECSYMFSPVRKP